MQRAPRQWGGGTLDMDTGVECVAELGACRNMCWAANAQPMAPKHWGVTSGFLRFDLI